VATNARIHATLIWCYPLACAKRLSTSKPPLTAEQIDQAVAKVASYSHQSLVDANKEIYD
jgi:hypothetical protein